MIAKTPSVTYVTGQDQAKLYIKTYTEMRETWDNRATIFTATGKEWTNVRTKHLTSL